MSLQIFVGAPLSLFSCSFSLSFFSVLIYHMEQESALRRESTKRAMGSLFLPKTDAIQWASAPFASREYIEHQ